MNDDSEGILFAASEDGERIPVIDVTHPAFRLEMEPRELKRQMKEAVETVRSHQDMPDEQRRRHMEDLLRGSFLAPRIAAARGRVLDGMSTYLLKLGPDRLGERASPVDRAIAASMPSLSCRLRLQHVAHLAADALAELLPGRPGAPLLVVNIAGGTGIDSLNALVVLRRTHPGLLDSRRIALRILDVDAVGPRFGARALEALQSGGSPLEGLQVDFRHVSFDWARAEELRTLQPAGGTAPVVAAFSEGGLLDYAVDEQVARVLREVLRLSDGGGFFAGSLSRGDGAARILNEAGQTAVRLRMLEAFTTLVAEAGWRAKRVTESPLSWEVLLVPGAG